MNDDTGLSNSAIQRATSSALPIRPSGTWSASYAEEMIPARAGWIGQVGRHAEGTAACLPDRIGALAEQRSPPPYQHHRGARGAEQPCGGRTDPAACAGDDDRRAPQPQID
jgi:hypothetical protein